MSQTSKSARGAPGKGKNKQPAGNRKVIVEFPVPLLKRMDQAAAELAMPRSRIIRAAVEHYLAQAARTSLEQQLAEGYAASAENDRRIAREFTHVDFENI
jgi:metal-responsive CopG/Arc/MetJ family transcriptional regulator